MPAKSRNNPKDQITEKSFSERVAEARAAVPAISPHAAKERHERGHDTVFIDPRDASGIASSTGIIPGALNLPLALLHGDDERDLPVEIRSRERPIITACQGGPMGALAAYALTKKGYTNVHFMEGGTQAWLDAGYSTIK